MFGILTHFIWEFCEDIIENIFAKFLSNMVETVLSIEKSMSGILSDGSLGESVFTNIYDVTLEFAVSLLVLVYLHKIFNIYVLKVEGDDSTSPFSITVSFAKAIAIMYSFTYIYNDIIVPIATDLNEKVLKSIADTDTSTNIADSFIGIMKGFMGLDSLIYAVLFLVYLIIIMVLFIKFLVTGVEIFILRVCIPFSCLSLLNNDNSKFASYINQLFMIIGGIIIQVALLQISLLLFFQNSMTALIFGVVFAMGSLKTPRLLEKFVITPKSGAGSSINTGINMTTNIKRLRFK